MFGYGLFFCIKKPHKTCGLIIFGADNEVRTRNFQLGRLTLYHLSYIRITMAKRNSDRWEEIAMLLQIAKGFFSFCFKCICLCFLQLSELQLSFIMDCYHNLFWLREEDSNLQLRDYETRVLPLNYPAILPLNCFIFFAKSV